MTSVIGDTTASMVSSAAETLVSLENHTGSMINATDQLQYPLILAFISSVYVQIFSGLCAAFASLVTFHQIYCHLRNYACYAEQRYIIRILLIIPAYALYSFISVMLAVHARMNSVFIEPIHDLAEALAIYSFLALCYQYLGGEGSIMIELFGKSIESSCLYGTCCFAGKPYTILFLRFCKVATLQYTLLKPFTSALSIILTLCHKYTVGDFSPTSGYLYLLIINNFTVSLALYGLLLFYFATRDLLRPFNPVLKFLTIKAIIFFSFWQDVLCTILEWSHVIYATHDYPAGVIGAGCKNVLICFELVFTAIALRYAFPYSIYVLRPPARLVLDFSPDERDWPGFAQNGVSKSDLQVIYGSKLASAAKLGHVRRPSDAVQSADHDRSQPPLPWDMVDSRSATMDGDLVEGWANRKQTAVPSISASIKATIDPRDIFADAVHNFHPSYRHYTQAKMDDSF